VKVGRGTIIAGVLLVAVSIIALDAWLSRDAVKEAFVTMKGLLDQERWEEAYALTSPEYRSRNSLEDFTGYEKWRSRVRDRNAQVFALFGRGTVTTEGGPSPSDASWRMGFERVGSRWFYRGDRMASVHFY
jgi:hypothetical protein